MRDTQNDSERRNLPFPLPKLTTTQWLIAALAVNLIFSSYLLAQQNRTQQAYAQDTSTAAVNSPTATPDLVILGSQLQELQNRLQVTSIQLAQKGSSMGYEVSIDQAQIQPVDENLPALWAEIDQVNKIMQPLMAQLEAATASHSARSQSEIIAMRTRVNTLHQRLAYLLARVEAVQARSNTRSAPNGYQWSPPAGDTTYSNNPNAAEYQQLYQNMVQMQQMLQQIQQGIAP